ncbi:MAG: nitric-oxide reductase large subunit, partial [Dokdonella sp.]
MTHAAQPLTPDDPELSPWWLRTVLIVLVLGFAGLGAMTTMAYRNAPPIPAQTLDAHGTSVFSGADISAGQAVFLKYGLMDNGSIWGHGAYLGPDYAAAALHRIGESVAAAIAQQQFQQPLAALAPGQLAAVHAETAVELKTNRYDATTGTLHLTAAQAAAYRSEVAVWTDYFRHPERNGGLHLDLVSSPVELHQFSAFVSWAAWASVTSRPGENHSYTNNFPFDPSVGNVATPNTLLWSALSLVILLGGIATVLLAFGKFDYLGWISH